MESFYIRTALLSLKQRVYVNELRTVPQPNSSPQLFHPTPVYTQKIKIITPKVLQKGEICKCNGSMAQKLQICFK